MTAKLAYLPVAAIVALLLSGCGGGSFPAADVGCAQTILGAEGRVDPGSSGLSCDGVKQVIGGGVPATPGGYLIETGEPRVTWKCRIYPSSGDGSNLLTCARDGKAFAVRRLK